MTSRPSRRPGASVPSNLYVGMQQRIANLEAALLTDKDDIDCDPEDVLRGVAFRVMASAVIEEYVEERCLETASLAFARFNAAQESSAARALIIWSVVRNTPGCIPLESQDVYEHAHLLEEAHAAYTKSVRHNHGLNSRDLFSLVNPIGLRSHQMPDQLADQLQALADRRDPAVHGATSKTIRRTGPSVERKQVQKIVDLLALVDDALDVASSTFPIPAPTATTP